MKKSKSPIKKKKFEMPSSIAILILLTIALAILTHLIPAGEYTRVDNVPIAGTYTVTEPNPQGIWDILAAPMEGFRGAIDIILFVFVLSGCLGILGKSRSLDAGLMYVINRLNGREKMMIPIVMIIASVGGTTFGFSEETIPFYPILIPMFMAMGYDAVSACMVLFLGAGAGIVGALINPFSVGIGSSVAGISLADGMLIRVVLYVAMVIASILFTMHYAEKVRKDPTKSVVYDMRSQIETHINKLNTEEMPEFTRQRKSILSVFAGAFVIMIIAIIPWADKFGIYIFPAKYFCCFQSVHSRHIDICNNNIRPVFPCSLYQFCTVMSTSYHCDLRKTFHDHIRDPTAFNFLIICNQERIHQSFLPFSPDLFFLLYKEV